MIMKSVRLIRWSALIVVVGMVALVILVIVAFRH
jgi:hypothetical protein